MNITEVRPIHAGQFLFVRIETDAGIHGVGEAGSWGQIEAAKAAIAGLDPKDPTSSPTPVPDYSAFFKSPGYEFRQEEGVRAIDRSASARGQLMSGGTLRELARYGQGLASSEFGNYANRLASLAGVPPTGGNVSGAAAGAVAGSAAGIAQTTLAGGTARASGIAAQGNIIGQGINQAGSALQGFGAGQGWWGGLDPSTGITWNTGRQGGGSFF